MLTKGMLISLPGMLLNPECFLPDNGLANLAGALLNTGNEVEIWDFGTTQTLRDLFPENYAREYSRTSSPDKMDERLCLLDRLAAHQEQVILDTYGQKIVRNLKEKNYHFVGFKLWHGDGFLYSTRLIKRIKKELPHIKIFVGGPHADIYSKEIFKFLPDELDAVVWKEGEKTISLLAEYSRGKASLENIPNIIYPSNHQLIVNPVEFIVDLDTLPYPVYTPRYYPALEGDQKLKIFVLDESRGCNRSCHFCIHPSKSGDKIRKKSVSRIIREIEYISKSTGSNRFRLAGSNTPSAFLQELGQKLIEHQIDIQYDAFAHVNDYRNISESELKQILASGCSSLFFGLESGSDIILNRSMNKKFSAKTAKEVFLKIKNSGIDLITSIIYPSPLENEITSRETFEFLHDVRPNSVIISMPGFFPGTEWGRKPEEFDIQLPHDFFEKFITYKLKMLYPPQYWEPLDFMMNGKKSNEIMLMNFQFREKLRKAALSVAVTEIINSLSKTTGRNKEEAVQFWQTSLFTGDFASVQEEISAINHHILSSSASSPSEP